MDIGRVDLTSVLAFADDTPVPTLATPTPEQLWYALLCMPSERRKQKLGLLLDALETTRQCWALDHAGTIRTQEAELKRYRERYDGAKGWQ